MFKPSINRGLLRVERDEMRWLSTGWNGGFSHGDVAYNISVPTGWDCTDVKSYVYRRRRRAGYDREGPTLLTALDLEHVRGARYESVEAYATVGLSNPAALPMDPEPPSDYSRPGNERPHVGTVNLIVGTTHSLGDAALATLLATAVEAKTATLLADTGFTGTTTDASVVGCDLDGELVEYSGSATPIGAATRACVRDAVRASLRSRYPDHGFPTSVEDAKYGVSTRQRAEVFTI